MQAFMESVRQHIVCAYALSSVHQGWQYWVHCAISDHTLRFTEVHNPIYNDKVLIRKKKITITTRLQIL